MLWALCYRFAGAAGWPGPGGRERVWQSKSVYWAGAVGGSSTLGAEEVALAPAGQDKGQVKALVDLATQVADVDVHDVGVTVLPVLVQMLKDHRPAEHPAGVRGQQLQQLELARRQADRPAGARHCAASRVDEQVVDLGYRWIVPVGPPVQGAQVGGQLLGAERLQQADVGAGVEETNPLAHSCLRRQRHDNVGANSPTAPVA